MELKEKCRQGVFKHYISLGHSCYVAMDLEELGLRDASYPLDWVNSPFGAAERAIKTRFDTFLEYDNLYQSKRTPTVYKNRDYMIAFPHDFDAYAKLSKQIGGVINKYSRRIERFYESMPSQPCFLGIAKTTKR